MDIKDIAAALLGVDSTDEAPQDGKRVRVLATFNLADFGLDETLNPDGTVFEPGTRRDTANDEEVP